jgi:predicted nucleic acid-binding protein
VNCATHEPLRLRLFKALVVETDSDKAKRLIEDYRNGIHELIAPDILPIEVGHALTRAERMGRISIADGYSLWSSHMADCPQLFPSLALMSRAYSLSSSARIGIYDCLYVALAQQEQCEIMTDDARLCALFPQHVFPLSSF